MKTFKKIAIFLLYKIIERIERYQYKHLNLDPNDNSKKIINEYPIDLEVLTDTGYKKAVKIIETQPYQHYKITLRNNLKLTCADKHVLFLSDNSEIYVENLSIGDYVKTKYGASQVKSIEKLPYKTSMYDLQIDSKDHRYYTNDILSHNTVSAAIAILWYITFNVDKNVMIMANKKDTSVEVVDKLKSIYKLLPFFLQVGVKLWNQGSITFDNGCRIKTAGRSKSPAIGFTIDFLYLDEFAHIPSNIIKPYYTAVYPTVSAINNSKIIITSTPLGYNLFYDLLTSAELEDGHPLKNTYKAMRCYWYQVPGRHVSYIRMNNYKMNEIGINHKMVYEYVKSLYMPNEEKNSNNIPMVQLKHNDDTGQYEIHIQNTEERNSDTIRELTIQGKDDIYYNITQFAEVSSWKEDAIKDIGGLEAFNQEYDLKFVSGAKSLFDEKVMERLMENKVEFLQTRVDIFDRKLTWDYTTYFYTINDSKIFNPSNRKKEKIIMSIDVSEGLGNDYSVINIFKVDFKPNDEIEENLSKYSTETDFLRLVQIGLFRANIINTDQLSEMIYMLAFEYFDEENVKIILELNNHGHAVLSAVPKVFEYNNNYGSHVFMRFKHNVEDKRFGVGIKIGRNKNLMVKDYQDLIKDRSIMVYEKQTIKEMSTFVKHETSAGNFTYRGDSAPDDIVMTLLHTSQAFSNVGFVDMSLEYFNTNITPEINKYYLEMKNVYLKNRDDQTDHNVFANAKRNIIERPTELTPHPKINNRFL